jgi:hypothetical protein
MYEMVIARWKKTWFFWVEIVIKSISMKKNVEFNSAIQIDNNWTHCRKLFYTMECAKLSNKGDLWC